MDPMQIMIIAGVGGVVLLTGVLAVKEYNEMTGPTYINRNWTVTEIPSNWRNKITQVRLSNSRPRIYNLDSKYRWTETSMDPTNIAKIKNQRDLIGGQRKTRRK